MIFLAVEGIAVLVLLVMAAYTIRHALFVLHRLFCRPKTDYTDLVGFYMPSISVLIPMHNEEAVAPDVLEALLEADYSHDPDRFEILPINDHSTDQTGAILDGYARWHPSIKPLHRKGGRRGKAAALEAGTQVARGEILVLFDADYVPGRSLLKFLVAPFADPAVGAVMGRVVPYNVGPRLLTRLLDLERAGGYQIDQQARYDLGLIAQYGGTAGGVRKTALKAVGGWNPRSLTEDTDLTFRLAIRGWKIAYLNRAECYEEVPETWEARRRQIERWAIGHTECLRRYLVPLLRSPHLPWQTKGDGVLLLGVYLTAPLILLGWIATVILFFAGGTYLPTVVALLLASTCCNALGNFNPFFEIANSVLLDGTQRRVRLLPLNIANFLFSTVAVSLALAKYYVSRALGRPLAWNKTQRYRNGNGWTNGNGAPGENGYANGRGLAHVKAKAAGQGSSGS
ncbi:MAG: glycosyltransferase family 2 protein [Acidobacteria bacterium]|nr:glycosyltransferase family 2 protein [Acidobacteriota bacterium]